MSPQDTSASGIPLARLEFAQRLRELRVPRGFRTARSLARALDIDENRYTRYERAEVEPDLTMIRRICQILQVSPGELLGATAPGEDATGQQNGADRSGTGDLQTAAWLLAEAAMSLSCNQTSSQNRDAAAPLAAVTETGRLYKALMDKPFEAISELLTQADVAKADLPSANVLRNSIDQFVSIIKSRS